MDALERMFWGVVAQINGVIEEDWVEDGRLNIKDTVVAAPLVEQANDILAELGDRAPDQYKGRQLLVYGTQLKLLPIERIAGAKALAATFQ